MENWLSYTQRKPQGEIEKTIIQIKFKGMLFTPKNDNLFKNTNWVNFQNGNAVFCEPLGWRYTENCGTFERQEYNKIMISYDAIIADDINEFLNGVICTGAYVGA